MVIPDTAVELEDEVVCCKGARGGGGERASLDPPYDVL